MKDLEIDNRKVMDKDILQLISEGNIGEEFQSGSTYKLVAKYKGELVGIIAYNVVETKDNGGSYPRILHIIFSEKFQRNRISYTFLKESEKILLRDGYTQILAYILDKKVGMVELAEKFGYKEYYRDSKGKFFCKNLEEE